MAQRLTDDCVFQWVKKDLNHSTLIHNLPISLMSIGLLSYNFGHRK